MRLFLLRHGQSWSNKLNNFINADESHLSDEGLIQIHTTAGYFTSIPLDTIITSTLVRTHETARPIIEQHPDSIVLEDARLIERRLGPYKEYNSQQIEIIAQEKGYPNRYILLDTIPDVEHTQHVQHRMIGVINEQYNINPNQTLLLVSHSAALKCLMLHLDGYVRDEATLHEHLSREYYNCGISEYTTTDGLNRHNTIRNHTVYTS